MLRKGKVKVKTHTVLTLVTRIVIMRGLRVGIEVVGEGTLPAGTSPCVQVGGATRHLDVRVGVLVRCQMKTVALLDELPDTLSESLTLLVGLGDLAMCILRSALEGGDLLMETFDRRRRRDGRAGVPGHESR